jgi:exopolysaccharide biosynthesis WecB/TagA/CpsF family protein
MSAPDGPAAASSGNGLPDRVRILRVPVFRGDVDQAVAEIERLYERGPALLAYVNAHTLNLAWRDDEYHRILNDAELVLNDGIGIQLAARMRRAAFPQNLNGSDLTPRILRLAATRGWRVFLLGAAPGVAERTADLLTSTISGLQIAGVHHGYLENDEVVASIREAKTDLLMVAMGNPLQEKWLSRHLRGTGARLGVGVGAFFDFTTGTQRRAPAWLNRIGLEWVFRLVHDPRRMWRRYVVGNPLFLWRAWRTKRQELAVGR